MKYFTIEKVLPKRTRAFLFGDRERFGLTPPPDDPCWIEWKRKYPYYYSLHQKRLISRIVQNAGYKVISNVDIDDKKILEIGAGNLNHMELWRGKPGLYVVTDTNYEMLDYSVKKLKERNIKYSSKLINLSEQDLPFADHEFDIVVAFYTIEHIHPLHDFLREILRVLKLGGQLVGAIPCDGGIMWGLGRLVTSRRKIMENKILDANKIFCWEHPNFASNILQTFDLLMDREHLRYWPYRFHNIDLNLIVDFIYKKYTQKNRDI